MKLLALTSLFAAGVACADAPPAPATDTAASRAWVTVPAKGGAKLTVTSPAFLDGSDIPFENTQYKGNTFPGLTWSAGPEGTTVYVIILEDSDARTRGTANPFLHWTMVNIPSEVTTLQPGMTMPPDGSAYGPSYKGAGQSYMGPRTPAGRKHRYHFQVFALDSALPAEALDSYDALVTAMKDHVLASGEVVGLGRFMPKD